jgi:hypothetical protein
MPGLENARASAVMKTILLIVALILAAVPASAANHSVEENKWLFIPVMVPEAKAGGGDFYNLRLEPVDDGGTMVEYQLQTDGVKIRSKNAGIYHFRLIVNHVVKSSCAGVAVNEYSNDQLVVQITK